MLRDNQDDNDLLLAIMSLMQGFTYYCSLNLKLYTLVLWFYLQQKSLTANTELETLSMLVYKK